MPTYQRLPLSWFNVNGRNGNPPKAGWNNWYIGDKVAGPVTQAYAPMGAETPTTAFNVFGSTQALVQSRERVGGMAFVAGTGEYGVATKGLGLNYDSLTISGLIPNHTYLFRLWGYETTGTWSKNTTNTDDKFGVWSTQNPVNWLAANYAPVQPGEPPQGGYGPKYTVYRPTELHTDSNMPNVISTVDGKTMWNAAMVTGKSARFQMDAGATDPGDNPLGSWTVITCASFYATTNPYLNPDYPGGDITIYGWIDPTDWSGSMHMPLNGFEVVPEPATVALLGLGGLALLRRKRA